MCHMSRKSGVGHLEMIRRVNRASVLNMIKNRQPISRAQISKQLGLSRATVSAIVDELIDKKMIYESDIKKANGKIGRRSTMLGFNPRSMFCIGLDVGGTKILTIITDLNGEILYQEKVDSTGDLEKMAKLIRRSLAACDLSENQIFGLGIGIPGTVLPEGIVVRAKALHWSDMNLKKELENRFDFPVYVGNDVNLAALGECWKGSGDQVKDMIFIALGTGVGSAILSDGKLIHGAQGRSGEIGYYLDGEDVRNHRLNHLGVQGVFEQKCSGTALNRFGCSSEELFQLYQQSDPEAKEIIDRFVLDLSLAIANSVSLINPTKVVIGGGVSESLNCVIDRVRENVAMLTPVQTEICLASLGSMAGALGAVIYLITQREYEDMRLH